MDEARVGKGGIGCSMHSARRGVTDEAGNGRLCAEDSFDRRDAAAGGRDKNVDLVHGWLQC